MSKFEEMFDFVEWIIALFDQKFTTSLTKSMLNDIVCKYRTLGMFVNIWKHSNTAEKLSFSFGWIIKIIKKATEILKKQLILHEPGAALAWIDAQSTMSGGKESRYTGSWNNTGRFTSNGSISFPLRCGNSYEIQIACCTDKKAETMSSNEIEAVLENYLQSRKRYVIVEQTNLVAIT